MKRITKICLTLYVIGGIVAFGHWMNNPNNHDPEPKAIGAFMVGAFWPLYVSTLLFEKS